MKQLIRWTGLALIFAHLYHGYLLRTPILLFIKTGLLNRTMPGLLLLIPLVFLTSILTGPSIGGSLLDPWMLRWRSRTLTTQYRLYRKNLVFSPVCSYCFDNETAEHILLHCPRLAIPRRSLFSDLSLRSPIT